MRHWIAVLFAMAGCATEPLIADYDATCEVADDCEAIVDEGYCGWCSSWGALSEEGADAFFDDQARYTRQHRCGSGVLLGCGPLGNAPPVACEQQECAVNYATPEDSDSQ